MLCRVKATPPTSATAFFRCSPRLSLRRTFASSRPTWKTHGPDTSFPDVPSSSTSHLRYLAFLVVPLGTFALFRMSPIALDEQLPPTETPPKLKGREPGELIRAEELESHTTVDKRIWVSIHGEIWDVTDFLDKHPGGSQIILQNAGKDVTRLYEPIHPRNAIGHNLQPTDHVGRLDPEDAKRLKGEPDEDEKRVAQARAELGHVNSMVNLDDFEAVAKKILSKKAWAYFCSAADDERTKAHNSSAFSRILFRPRVLRKVKDVDPSTTMLGYPTSLPVFVSPTAQARLGHEGGECNITEGAGETGIIQAISNYASCSLEEINEVRKTDQKLLWQIYFPWDREKASAALRRAVDQGMNAIILTVDTPVVGNREAELRHKLDMNPPKPDQPTNFRLHQGATAEVLSAKELDLSWDIVPWIKKIVPELPLVVKGIATAEDALLAFEHGADAIILSNHGGRQLEFAPPPIHVLQSIRHLHPELLARDSKFEVYLDGSIRRGTDVLKALCLGARGVGLGRTFLYAQSAWGKDGVAKAVEILDAEIRLGMRLLGVTRIDQLGPEYVECLEPTGPPEGVVPSWRR